MAIGAAVASIAGGAMQARSARKAADAQAQASREQLALQREMFDMNRNDLAPFRQAGGVGLDAYMYELGLGNAPMIGGQAQQVEEVQNANQFASLGALFGGSFNQPTGNSFRVGDRTFTSREEAEAFARANPTGGQQFRGISMSPAAQFALTQGMDQVQGAAAMRGGMFSGATMADLERNRFGLAAQDREMQLNRLAGLADMGQGAAAMNAQNANAMAGMGSAALANRGNAQAAGFIGQGNAIAGTLGNLSSIYGYMQGGKR
jgi:hypothetical protein